MYYLFIFFLELFFILGGISLLVLGQSVLTVIKHKKPFKHFFLMTREILKVAPRKGLDRLSCALIIGVIIFVILQDPRKQIDPASFMSLSMFAVFGYFNFLISIFAFFCLLTGKKKKKRENDWVYIRIRAHRCVYGNHPKYNEYGTILESFK